MTYEIGAVYIWQNQDGELACLNGTECTVTGPEKPYIGNGRMQRGWPTDSQMPNDSIWHEVMAWPGDLRRKRPPLGEESIIRLFGLTAPAPREVEAA